MKTLFIIIITISSILSIPARASGCDHRSFPVEEKLISIFPKTELKVHRTTLNDGTTRLFVHAPQIRFANLDLESHVLRAELKASEDSLRQALSGDFEGRLFEKGEYSDCDGYNAFFTLKLKLVVDGKVVIFSGPTGAPVQN